MRGGRADGQCWRGQRRLRCGGAIFTRRRKMADEDWFGQLEWRGAEPPVGGDELDGRFAPGRPVPLDGAAQAFLERDDRLVAEEPPWPWRCRPASRGRRRRAARRRSAPRARRRSRASSSNSWFSEMRPPVATLITSPLAPGASHGAQHAVDDVGDVGEVARLLAVAVDRRRPALEQRRREHRDDAGVRRRRDPGAARRR